MCTRTRTYASYKEMGKIKKYKPEPATNHPSSLQVLNDKALMGEIQ